MKHFVNDLKFSESGVRGVVGEGLTPRLVCALAAAFGSYIGRGGKIVLGRDTRASGAMLENAVVAGLLGSGCQVVKLGVVPTPTVQLMVEHLNARGGIAITASHNAEPFNALKFIDRDGCFLDRNAAAELFDVFSQEESSCVSENRLREVTVIPDAFAVHEAKIHAAGIDAEAIRARHFRVAADCINGVGALYTRHFLEHLGCEVFTLNDTPDGHFARQPEPTPEVLQKLAELVKKEHCDIGFAHDPDGDRLTLVDELGNILSPHLTVALAVEHVMGTSDQPSVVNIQTTRAVEDIVRSYGEELIYAKVGEINVVETMKQCGSEIGGEGNCGGVIWSRVHYGRDSFAAMALLLEMLGTSHETLSEILATMPRYCNVNTRFSATPLESRHVIETLIRRYRGEKILTFDGVRIDFANGWILVRGSNTEHILRLNAESQSAAEAEKLLERFRGEIETIIKQKDSQ